MGKVTGFTKKQRNWFLERDQWQCMFHEYSNRKGKWLRCRHVKWLQVHHIIPRGWAAMHLPPDFPINGSTNGIVLCSQHHVGNASVHPDTWEAKEKYRGGNKKAYTEMAEARAELNHTGKPYWNTVWDWMFTRLARKRTASFSKKKKYPENRNRGLTGRRRDEDP